MPDPLVFTNLGANPSPYDYRDAIDPTLARVTAPPPTWETLYLPPVEDFYQKKIGICTSSLVSIVEWVNWKKTGVYTKLSRRFLYSVGKNLIDGNTIEGSSLRTMLKVAYNYGICTDAIYPSDVGEMSHNEYCDLSKIPAAAWGDAKKYKIAGYVNVGTDEASLKAAIFKYGLVYAMKTVGAEWWTSPQGEVTWKGILLNPLRKPAEIVSGHAMVYYGYDETSIKLLNDWSSAWSFNDTAYFHPNEYPTIEAWALTTEMIPNDLPAAEDFHHTFKITMQRGDHGEEVRNLQIALMISGDLEFVQPDDRSFFGSLTQAAVLRFQLRRGIPLSYTERYIYAGRYAGAKTLAALNQDFK